ncbi:TetR/AcrR family transcriptional regulator [Flexivirga oryzae]|uniref:AcrR family transcriptional regulator n=1 Tax=Flexivirga oryzae TaxID=1794944 RepID=A0A839NH90_9MICO|nr:TetR/AcrR family transcriptional regulator [Flexivirga oryzae]MBB2893792.1 AcrR family transcriptional regulator [Flexivirga oryzae]
MARRSGRPSTALLSRDGIVDCAYRLMREEPLDRVSLARIAAELGVRTPSLYNHVDGWDELLNGVRGRVIEQFDLSGFGHQPWRAAFERWIRSYIDAFATLHPTACAAIAVLPMKAHPAAMAMYEVVCTAMLEQGLPDDDVLPMLVAIESFAIGSALDLRAPDLYTAPDAPDRYPNYYRLFTDGDGNRRERSVAAGVEALLDELAIRLEQPEPAATAGTTRETS